VDLLNRNGLPATVVTSEELSATAVVGRRAGGH
jgi:hypothetical protein